MRHASVHLESPRPPHARKSSSRSPQPVHDKPCTRLVPPVTSAVPSTVSVVGVTPGRASSQLCSSCACVEAPKARSVDSGKGTNKGTHMERGIIYAAMSCTRTSLGDGCREGSCEDDAIMPPGVPSASSARALFVCHSFCRFLDSV